MINMTAKFNMKPTAQIFSERGIDKGGRVQRYIDTEVLWLCSPRVPHDTGILERSGIINTKVGSGLVIYGGGMAPYARRWYYRPASFQGAPMRGNYWFEKMKKNGGVKQIKAGAARIVRG